MRSRPIAVTLVPFVALALLLPAVGGAQAVDSLAPELSARVAAAVNDAIRSTQVPSASVGIVRGGHIVYIRGFGHARLSPPLKARPDMQYAIGSISKQFTVAAVMLLQQEGKLFIDQPVATWFPELTRAREVTLRNLMSHTSGYEDLAPQDYTIPDWTKPTSPQKVVHEWATKPLDFDPGTQYQYSNTNYSIVGLIVEKVSGQPFWQFLESRVLQPLGLRHTIDLDAQRDQMEPTGYFRHALGPLRPALSEAPGWSFADGEIAMPVGDLLAWDISVMNQTLLSPASYAEMEAPTKLKDGKVSNYGLGFSLGTVSGHRVVSHGGEVGGFVAANYVFPDDSIAIAVLTNQEANPAASTIARSIIALMVSGVASTSDASAETWAREVLTGLQHGRIDRSRFTANGNFYFDAQAIRDYRTSLAPFGAIASLRESSKFDRGGMTYRGFAVEFVSGKRVNLSTFTVPGGRIEQFLVEPTG